MAVSASDIKFYLVPTGNSDPAASLGGSGNGSEIGAGIDNIFADVSPAEALAGSVKYRAISVKNTNVTDTLYAAVVWVSAEDSSPDTIIALAYDSTGTQSVANENTAPSSPTLSFSHPTTQAAGIALGDIAAGASKRIWMRRTVTSGAAALNPDAGEISVAGGTA
jgi:hypothetical protein